MDNPLISIISINYNDAQGLQKTMESVLEQSYSHFEYIVIDGDSTDGSKEVIKKHQDKLSYWVSEKDSGIYSAMNKGIRASRGTYLLFLNSGDWLTNKEALQDFIAHPNFNGDIIYGDYSFDEGEKIYPDTLTPLYFMRSSLPHQSTFFKKDVFSSMGMFDETYAMGGDRAFFIKSFLSGHFQFTHVKYFLTHFNLEGVSNSETHRKQKKAEDDRMFREYYGVFYDDYKRLLQLEQEVKDLKKSTPQGVAKRVQTKLKKLWVHRRW